MKHYIPKIIRIPLDGMVVVRNNDFNYMPIIDSPNFQRLRYISQLDMAWLIYPGATHTRFEHSIGTMEKFNKMFVYKNSAKAGPNRNDSSQDEKELNKDDLSEDEKQAIKIAALLHDTTQGPYSHLTGYIEQAITGESHDDHLPETLKKHYEDPLEECGFSVADIQKVTDKKNPMREIIWGMVGADKLDYTQRDMYHVGLPLPDIEPMLAYAIFRKDRGLYIEEKNATNVIKFYTDYCTAHKEVYWRKASLISGTMMRRAILNAIENDVLSLEQLHEMMDWEVNASLKKSEGRSRELFEKILLRQLYKTAITFKISDRENFERTGGKDISVVEVPEEQANRCFTESKDLKRIVELETDLSRELSTDLIISTTPEPERLRPKNPRVYSIDREEIQWLSNINKEFLQYLSKVSSQIWTIRIAVPEKDRKRISENPDPVIRRLLFN